MCGDVTAHGRIFPREPTLAYAADRIRIWIVIALATRPAAFPRKRLVKTRTKRIRGNVLTCRGQDALVT